MTLLNPVLHNRPGQRLPTMARPLSSLPASCIHGPALPLPSPSYSTTRTTVSFVSPDPETSPFAAVVTSTGPMAKSNPIRFSTKWWDQETGWYYYGYRYLDPETGRWVSKEPFHDYGFMMIATLPVGTTGSVGWHAYLALANRPVDTTDFLGLLTMWEHIEQTCAARGQQSVEGHKARLMAKYGYDTCNCVLTGSRASLPQITATESWEHCDVIWTGPRHEDACNCQVTVDISLYIVKISDFTVGCDISWYCSCTSAETGMFGPYSGKESIPTDWRLREWDLIDRWNEVVGCDATADSICGEYGVTDPVPPDFPSPPF